ncbi:hypothetical protein FC62_GL001437 [Amylolactobacillus amylotrophicus DSM 20534]|uniref:DUF5067 domain-containing protein n=3 Tax=Amylolactobacillus TaxID=2767876 RepID=A0A0R1YGT1_9LACO|nr:hypothetical protein FC62_GL001437 [Amylolactobacillus amylotrophicus DSM 20534]KRM41720.1 hypothetical protein FD40_GL001283 [Amylolactobacillus amylophilus DSM 20533 = JCM 1125]
MEEYVMKKTILLVGTMLSAALLLSACSNDRGSSNDSAEKASKVESKKSTKQSTKKSSSEPVKIPTSPDKEWFYNDNVFYAGMETMTLTKSEIRDGIEDGEKVLVIYNTIKNNSDEEQDPSNFYMVIHAKQKTDTSNVNLDPGTLALDENGNNPLQAQEDNLNNSLLPGKTVETVMMFKLVNDTPVTIEFSNEDFTTIGTKTINVN